MAFASLLVEGFIGMWYFLTVGKPVLCVLGEGTLANRLRVCKMVASRHHSLMPLSIFCLPGPQVKFQCEQASQGGVPGPQRCASDMDLT